MLRSILIFHVPTAPMSVLISLFFTLAATRTMLSCTPGDTTPSQSNITDIKQFVMTMAQVTSGVYDFPVVPFYVSWSSSDYNDFLPSDAFKFPLTVPKFDVIPFWVNFLKKMAGQVALAIESFLQLSERFFPMMYNQRLAYIDQWYTLFNMSLVANNTNDFGAILSLMNFTGKNFSEKTK